MAPGGSEQPQHLAFVVDVDAGNAIRHARLAFGGVAATPVRAMRTEAALIGLPFTIEGIRPALAILDPQYFPSVRDPQRYGQYVEAVGEVARREAVPVFGRYDAMREWHRSDAEAFKAALWTDGFHMSDAGYDCLARDMASGMFSLTAAGRPVVAQSN